MELGEVRQRIVAWTDVNTGLSWGQVADECRLLVTNLEETDDAIVAILKPYLYDIESGTLIRTNLDIDILFRPIFKKTFQLVVNLLGDSWRPMGYASGRLDIPNGRYPFGPVASYHPPQPAGTPPSPRAEVPYARPIVRRGPAFTEYDGTTHEKRWKWVEGVEQEVLNQATCNDSKHLLRTLMQGNDRGFLSSAGFMEATTCAGVLASLYLEAEGALTCRELIAKIQMTRRKEEESYYDYVCRLSRRYQSFCLAFSAEDHYEETLVINASVSLRPDEWCLRILDTSSMSLGELATAVGRLRMHSVIDLTESSPVAPTYLAYVPPEVPPTSIPAQALPVHQVAPVLPVQAQVQPPAPGGDAQMRLDMDAFRVGMMAEIAAVNARVGNGGGNGNGNQNGNMMNTRGSGRYGNANRRPVTCFGCGLQNHKRYECPNPHMWAQHAQLQGNHGGGNGGNGQYGQQPQRPNMHPQQQQSNPYPSQQQPNPQQPMVPYQHQPQVIPYQQPVVPQQPQQPYQMLTPQAPQAPYVPLRIEAAPVVPVHQVQAPMPPAHPQQQPVNAGVANFVPGPPQL